MEKKYLIRLRKSKEIENEGDGGGKRGDEKEIRRRNSSSRR